MRYTIILTPRVDGIAACVPAMPGCSASGRTRAEALASIATAMRHWLAVEGFHGRPPLAETRTLMLDALARALDDLDQRRASDAADSVAGYQLELTTLAVPHAALA